MLKSVADCRLRTFRTVVVGLALAVVLGCTEPPPAPPTSAPTPDPSGRPTVVVIQGTAPTTGLGIEDRCVTGNMATRQGPGRITGGGLDMEFAIGSLQAFSEAVIKVADTVCPGTSRRSDIEQLVRSLNDQGITVTRYTWSGA